ncbi:MAG TPA: hypothetical protein VKC65_00555 [Gaiellaceae bacterium]|nr:hypothetical protein [Gaiellaceae bacterium]
MAGDSRTRKVPVKKRDVRKFRILGYSSLVFAVVVAVLMLSTGNTGFGIVVLVGAVFLGLSLWWIERSMMRDVDAA